MSRTAPDIVRLARALSSRKVQYVVIGGIALMLYGSNHVTMDCDLAISSDPANVDELVEALRPLNPRPIRAGGREYLWDRLSIVGPYVRLITDAGEVDLMRRIVGVESFAKLYERSNVLDLDGTPLRVASIDDLRRMKEVAPRERDMAHLRELKALQRVESEDESEMN